MGHRIMSSTSDRECNECGKMIQVDETTGPTEAVVDHFVEEHGLVDTDG